MYNEFLNYMEKFIDFEEMKVVAYITFSVIISIIIALQVEKYYNSLYQAYQKEVNGEGLTCKERRRAKKFKKYINKVDTSREKWEIYCKEYGKNAIKHWKITKNVILCYYEK